MQSPRSHVIPVESIPGITNPPCVLSFGCQTNLRNLQRCVGSVSIFAPLAKSHSKDKA